MSDYNKEQGSPFQCGSKDYYYAHGYYPNYQTGMGETFRTYSLGEMTPAQIAEYTAGYRDAEEYGVQKDYGHDE